MCHSVTFMSMGRFLKRWNNSYLGTIVTSDRGCIGGNGAGIAMAKMPFSGMSNVLHQWQNVSCGECWNVIWDLCFVCM